MSDPTIPELLANLDSPRDGGHWLNLLWPETRAVIEEAEKTVGVRSECPCALCRALAAWRTRAQEVIGG